MEFLHIGYGNFINQSHIIAVRQSHVDPLESALLYKAEDFGLLLDFSGGRPRKSVILMDSGHHILSAILPEELKERMA